MEIGAPQQGSLQWQNNNDLMFLKTHNNLVQHRKQWMLSLLTTPIFTSAKQI